MTGFVVFIVTAYASALAVLIHGSRARYVHHRAAASVVKEMAVTGGSLAAYVVVCSLLGYGVLPQLLGCLAGCAVLWSGRGWVPALAHYAGRQTDA